MRVHLPCPAAVFQARRRQFFQEYLHITGKLGHAKREQERHDAGVKNGTAHSKQQSVGATRGEGPHPGNPTLL